MAEYLLVSRKRFMEIVAELDALNQELRPLLDRRATLEAERDALWPEELPAPAQLNRASREVAEAAVEAVESMAPLVVRNRGAIRADGPTAQARVLAFLETCPASWLKARRVSEGMGLGPAFIPGVRASLDRLVATGSVQKNEDGEYRLAVGARRTGTTGTEAAR